MAVPKRAFVSFDYDHDAPLKHLLVGQAKLPGSPFEIHDWSIKEASPTWRDEARRRIRASDVVIVICGEHTHTAKGVAIELEIAQQEGIPYFLLWGYADKTCTKPTAAEASDKVYKWAWDNLESLIGGAR
ncbi:TIR domain-containing protein [Microtetraspora malaysiensis]|uniref:TIR domain-containing protein n=1 Tax=Microtetraspora malaysiensis TaxID=161358 RepID=UPI003D8A21CF